MDEDQTMAEATAPPRDLTPAAQRTISDVETLKALSEPVRLRILEAMVQAPNEDWTVKRIATALDVGPTKLYHHIGILEEHEFIRPSGTRVVSGIIETRYRIAQLSVRLDRALLSGGAAGDPSGAFEAMIGSVFDSARDDVSAAFRSGAMTPDDAEASPSNGIVKQGIGRMTPARMAAFKQRVQAVLAEFDGDGLDDDDEGSAVPYGLLVALYPVPDARAAGEGDVDEGDGDDA